jgi:hypothetical protein
VGEGGLDESGEERMRFVWLGLEFRMKLYPDEPRVILHLYDFDQVAFRMHARNA